MHTFKSADLQHVVCQKLIKIC